MLTHFTVIPVIGALKEVKSEFAPKPGYDALRRLIEPYLDGERLEQVTVLHEGQRRDMFVGECSAINGRAIRNVRATEIYRNNVLTRRPRTNPEALPAISGPAVLFYRRVWF